MSRKSTRNYSKLLGGLGAMYALSKLPVGEGVSPTDVNPEDAARDKAELQERLARLRAPAPALPKTQTVEPEVKSRVFIPHEFRDNREPFKKGGSVKGWGKARGARKAKVY